MNPDVFFENFELLADAPNGVQKLRELILQLAVMGKLVPQDPNDEPASVLLEKIKAEEKKLINEGKIKGSKQLPEISDTEVLFEIPESWKWIRFDDICSTFSTMRFCSSKGGRGKNHPAKIDVFRFGCPIP